jgi:hypothetical protein
MRQRARRVAIAAAILGTGIFGLLVAINGTKVMDHAQGRYFVMTTNTRTAYPGTDDDASSGNQRVFQVLADCLGDPVIFDPAKPLGRWVIDETVDWRANRTVLFRLLKSAGWQLTELQVPRAIFAHAPPAQVPQ